MDSRIDANAATPPEAGMPAPLRERRASLGLLAILGALAAVGTLSTNIILPAFPSIAGALAVPTAALGVTLSAFFFAFALGQLLVGPISDRFGRRPVVLGGLAIFLAGTALCAAVSDLEWLVVGRIVQALGVCAASVLSRAIARDLFQGEALARVLSLTMVASAAAPGFSPLLGSGLDHVAGWRSTFIVVGALGLLLAVIYARRVGETHPADRRVPIRLPSILGAYARLLGDRRFIMPALAVGLLMGSLFGMFAGAPLILMEGFGLSAAEFGVYFATIVFLVFAAGLLAPRVGRRLGMRRTALAGLVLVVAGGLSLIISGAAGQASLPTFIVSISVFLFGMGFANPLGTAIALSPFGKEAGLASALLGFLQMVAAGAAATLATALTAGPYVALGIVQAAFGGAAFLLLLGMPAARTSTRAA